MATTDRPRAQILTYLMTALALVLGTVLLTAPPTAANGEPQVIIDTVTPCSGGEGTEVTISGSGFDNVSGLAMFLNENQSEVITIDFKDDTTIVITMPALPGGWTNTVGIALLSGETPVRLRFEAFTYGDSCVGGSPPPGPPGVECAEQAPDGGPAPGLNRITGALVNAGSQTLDGRRIVAVPATGGVVEVASAEITCDGFDLTLETAGTYKLAIEAPVGYANRWVNLDDASVDTLAAATVFTVGNDGVVTVDATTIGRLAIPVPVGSYLEGTVKVRDGAKFRFAEPGQFCIAALIATDENFVSSACTGEGGQYLVVGLAATNDHKLAIGEGTEGPLVGFWAQTHDGPAIVNTFEAASVIAGATGLITIDVDVPGDLPDPVFLGISPACGLGSDPMVVFGQNFTDDIKVRLTPTENQDLAFITTSTPVLRLENTPTLVFADVPLRDQAWTSIFLDVEVVDGQDNPIPLGQGVATPQFRYLDNVNQFAVSGVVLDAVTGQPVTAGDDELWTEISIYRAPYGPDDVVIQSVADPQDQFRQSCLEPGNYRVGASAPGYTSSLYPSSVAPAEFTVNADGVVTMQGGADGDTPHTIQIRLSKPTPPPPPPPAPPGGGAPPPVPPGPPAGNEGAPLPGVPESLAGTDRVETALAIAAADFVPVVRRASTVTAANLISAKAAVLVSSTSFADGVTAGPLAMSKDAPLLLTPGTRLDARTATALTTYVPEGATVYLVGGPAALSDEVFDAVKALGYQPLRLSGVDRYATAIDVATRGLGNPEVLYVATGGNFADALSAGVIAARRNGAVVLTNGDQVPAALSAYVASRPGVSLIAVGGPAAAAFPTATLFVGRDRYQTATSLAASRAPTGGLVGLASGERFADALAATPYVARRNGVLLLTRSDSLPLATVGYLRATSGITEVQVFGGLSAVGDAARRAASEAVS